MAMSGSRKRLLFSVIGVALILAVGSTLWLFNSTLEMETAWVFYVGLNSVSGIVLLIVVTHSRIVVLFSATALLLFLFLILLGLGLFLVASQAPVQEEVSETGFYFPYLIGLTIALIHRIRFRKVFCDIELFKKLRVIDPSEGSFYYSSKYLSLAYGHKPGDRKKWERVSKGIVTALPFVLMAKPFVIAHGVSSFGVFYWMLLAILTFFASIGFFAIAHLLDIIALSSAYKKQTLRGLVLESHTRKLTDALEIRF